MRLEGLNEDFRDILNALLDEDVEFLIVGAWAVAMHGYPRATIDFDLFVRPGAENALRVIRALVVFGAPLDAHGVTDADFVEPGTVYQLGQPPRRIDLMNEISGVSFERAWASREECAFETRTVAFLGRDALIENKRASARPKDLVDVERLERAPPRGG
jgi:hypothetical protein